MVLKPRSQVCKQVLGLLLAVVLMPTAYARLLGEVDHGDRVVAGRLIVVGFMGGHVSANNLTHRGAREAQDLQQKYPTQLHTEVFGNHDGKKALRSVVALLDADGDGSLSATEKGAARIVIYGHSWGASETVTLARRLNDLDIPVLLTIQIDSVQKSNQDDGSIPPNVREAVNFYQTEGMLHGRKTIVAMDPKQTTVLGNYEYSYRDHPIPCPGYSWIVRTLMHSHIEIENDPAVWTKIEALIRALLP